MFGMLEVTDNPLNYSGEIDRPGEFCYNMSALYHLTKMDCCPARFFDCYSYSRTFLDLFLFFNLVFFFCSCFPPIGKFGLLLPQFPSTFRQTQKWMPKSGCPKVGALFLLHSLRLFSCWLGRSLIIWEIFHRRLSLNWMLLQLLLNFVNGSRL